MKKQVHFFLGAKGGIGKTLMANFFCQYLLEKQKKFIAYDLNVCSQGLSKLSYFVKNNLVYEFALDLEDLTDNIRLDGGIPDSGRHFFTKMSNLINNYKLEGKIATDIDYFLVDIESALFGRVLPFIDETQYILRRVATIGYEPVEVVIHSVLTSSDWNCLSDCLDNLVKMLEYNFNISNSQLSFAVWLNPVSFPIQITNKTKNIVPFMESDFYAMYSNKIKYCVDLSNIKVDYALADNFKNNVRGMLNSYILSKNLLFKEFFAIGHHSVVMRCLQEYQKNLFVRIDNSRLVVGG